MLSCTRQTPSRGIASSGRCTDSCRTRSASRPFSLASRNASLEFRRLAIGRLEKPLALERLAATQIRRAVRDRRRRIRLCANRRSATTRQRFGFVVAALRAHGAGGAAGKIDDALRGCRDGRRAAAGNRRARGSAGDHLGTAPPDRLRMPSSERCITSRTDQPVQAVADGETRAHAARQRAEVIRRDAPRRAARSGSRDVRAAP